MNDDIVPLFCLLGTYSDHGELVDLYSLFVQRILILWFCFQSQEHVYDGRLRKALKLDEGKKATDKNPDDEFL